MKPTSCTALLLLLLAAATLHADELGYPRPMSFRMLVNDNLEDHSWMTMVVSDMHMRRRSGVEAKFKQLYPDRPTLVQINNEGLFLWGTWIMAPKQRLEDLRVYDSPHSKLWWPIIDKGVYPAIDFPGYWAYEAGAESTSVIPANEQAVTISVSDMAPFAPNDNVFNRSRTGRPFHQKDIVICPRGDTGELDWLEAEFASITALDEANKTITVRRWETKSRNWPERPAGTYLAPSANQIVLAGFNEKLAKLLEVRSTDFITPFVPNITSHCPRDPRNGLNAAEWLARHFTRVLKDHYPESDGLAIDVAAATFHPSPRISDRSDCNVDGIVDRFYFDSIDHWALGMYDFMYLLRHGKPGVFEGLGEQAVFTSDGNENSEQRFLDLVNGIEVEHSMSPPHAPSRFSSNLDRLLVWEARARRPHISFIHHKYPVDSYHGGPADKLADYMHDNWYRLDMACAAMATGYVGKGVSRPGGEVCRPDNVWRTSRDRKGRVHIPPDWDEYHCGTDMQYNWLGMPTAPATRVTAQLSPPILVFGSETALPHLAVNKPWQVDEPRHLDKHGLTVNVRTAHPHQRAGIMASLSFPLGAIKPDTEYTLRMRVKAECPYARAGERYAKFPRNLLARLVQDGKHGPLQEMLVFTDARDVVLTLTSPSGKLTGGTLLLGIGEEPGLITIESLELCEGCGDVMFRKFEHGLVVLNGSPRTPATLDFAKFFPGEQYRRIKGTQDPKHNNGEPVGGRLVLQPRDGIYLRLMKE